MLRVPSAAFAVTLLASLATAGCGFVASGGDHPTGKPDTFLLHGYVSVAGVAAGPPGSSCTAPAASSDIHPGGTVRVADPDGHTLGVGELAAGVLGPDQGSPHCNFPFDVAAVPGGVTAYVIGVGSRPAVSFPAAHLRQNAPAVIPVEG